MKTALKFMATFAAGLLIGGTLVWGFGVGQNHVRQETKMANYNRNKAIEKGDRAMQTYFEEVITWNAFMYLSPRMVMRSTGSPPTWKSLLTAGSRTGFPTRISAS